MTIPVYIPGMHISDNGELVIDANEMAEAGVKSVEFIEQPATEAGSGEAELICWCGHSANTHDPCCVSACGCDFFNPREPVLPAEDVLKAVMREIKQEAEYVLGYEQICEPIQAVRRLAQEFATVKAQLAAREGGQGVGSVELLEAKRLEDALWRAEIAEGERDDAIREREEAEAQLANTRRLLEISDARVNRLSEQVKKAEADAARLLAVVNRIVEKAKKKAVGKSLRLHFQAFRLLEIHLDEEDVKALAPESTAPTQGEEVKG